MGLPARLLDPIRFTAGDDKTITLRFWQDKAKTVPLNLSTLGVTLAAKTRPSPESTTAIAFAIDTSSWATGIVLLKLTAAQTASMNGNYGFSLEATHTATSRVLTFFAGQLLVDGDFTR